jgi:MFS family permease
VAPPELRGTAFGMFNFLGGLALLAAGIIAGALWDTTGPQGTFLVGAAFATLALGGLLVAGGRLAKAPGASGH